MINKYVSAEVAKRSEVLNNMSNTALDNLIKFAEFDSDYLHQNIETKRALIVDEYFLNYCDNYQDYELSDIDENEMKELVELIDGIVEDVINEL